MHPQLRIRQYQRESLLGAPPERLVAKLYDIALAACYSGDRPRLRAALVELIGSLDFELGGELAQRLHSIYVYALTESALGDLQPVAEVLDGLRGAWNGAVVQRHAA